MYNIQGKLLSLDMQNIDASITDLLALAVKHETTDSSFEKQVVTMKAGKIRKVLRQANNESIQDRIGVKPEN